MNDPSASAASRWWRVRVAPDNLLARVFLNAGILVGGKGVSGLLSLAYIALAVRTLGVETFGILLLVHTYAQAVGGITKFQSWQAILRYGTPALQNGRTGEFQSLIKFTGLLDIASGIGGALLAALGCGFAAPLLGWPAEIVPMAMLYCASIVFMGTETPTGLLRLFDRFDLLATQSAVASFTRLLGSAVLFTVGGTLTDFLILWFISIACAGATRIGFAWRETARQGLFQGLTLSWRGLTAPFAGIWRFVWTTNLNTSAAMLSTHLPTLLIGGLLGATEAALYRIARQLAQALIKPAKLLVPAIYPEFARLAAAGSVERIRHLVGRSLMVSGIGAVVCFAVIWLFGELLLRLIAGEEAAPAAQLMVLLGAAALITLAAFPLEPLLMSVGLEGTALRARLVSILLYLPIIVVLVRVSGLTGAGLAAIAAALLILIGQAIPAIRWLMHHSRKKSGRVDSGLE